MKLSVSAYRAHASAHKKILSSGYHSQLNYGSTGAAAASSSSSATAAVASTSSGLYTMDPNESMGKFQKDLGRIECNSDTDVISPTGTSSSGGGGGGGGGQSEHGSGGGGGGHHHHHHKRSHKLSTQQSGNSNGQDDDNNSNAHSSDSKSPSQRKSRIGDGASDPDSDWTRSNQRWMKLRTTVQISSAIQKKPPLKREDSFLKRFSTRQIPETQETVEDTGSESASGDVEKSVKRRRRYLQKRRSVVNPDENFYFYWLMMLTVCVLYNLWTLIVRQSFPELQEAVPTFWLICDILTDVVFVLDIIVQLRTGYLEQGLMVYDDKKLACHYVHSRDFIFDMIALIPLDLLQLKMGTQPLLRFTRFFKVYRSVRFYYIVESRTVWPNLWRVVNLIHILLILAHWFGCFYYLLSEAEGFQGDWVYPYRPGDYATLTRKYLGSLYWSTLTLTTIGDLPTPETNAEPNFSVDGPRSIPRRGIKSRLLQFGSSYGYIFTIVSYLIGVFIFATIVGQVGNVITNRNANRLEFERLLDGAKTYMRHHKVPGGMKRRVLRWYDYSWSRGRIQGGGDINTALGLLPDKLKTELALHVNLSVLKKVTIFQECQPEFLHDLVLKMKAYIFTPGDSICRKGEVAREMFIIADGILEVLSETGKVLTTMKAGDFFGEIGILNLDGLNKRTADVRSVGYSELFSLSREDVLAAMKDYPDAQEILQTLGRKRLMEVRCVNKKYAKAQLEKENAAYAAAHPGHQPHPGHHPVHQSDSSENSASKKIVDKLKHDVKGFRNVLKKSRTSRKSDESLEMQPLHNTSPRGSKTMLKRMSRVRSDEKDDSAEAKDELHDKTPSPIGAGLPLLQRLRLLKEKQDREERAVKSTPPQKSPPHSHVTCTLSPQESIQEEPEREFSEGFPLIQRLQQLKIRNEPQANDAATMQATISGKVDTHANQLMLNAAGSTATTTTAATTTNYSTTAAPAATTTTAQTLTIAQIKPIMKVSFKQKIQQLQGGGGGGGSGASSSHATVHQTAAATTTTAAAAATATTSSISSASASTLTGAIAKKEPPKSLAVIAKHAASSSSSAGSGGSGSGSGSTTDTRHKPIATISRKVFKPSYRSMPMQYSDTDTDTTTPIRPWSKLKLATLISSSYTSLTNCSPEDISSPLKNYSLGNIPAEQAKEFAGERDDEDNEYGGLLKTKATSSAKSALKALRTGNGQQQHHHQQSQHGHEHGHGHSHGHGHGHSHAHSSAMHTTMTTTTRECLQSISLKASTRLNKKKTSSEAGGIGSGSGALSDTQTQSQRTKLYQSVFDLSPEYCGLPFVKRLKILNERQKLAELEKALQTRSFSLDCSKTRTNNDDDGVGGVGVGMPETLYRCYSDTSGIYSQFMTATYESTTSSTTSSASASVSDNPKQQQQPQQQQQQQHQLESVQQEYVPLSPESNETFERRKLKSILKKLHKSRDSITTTTTTAAVPTAAAAGATTTTAMRAPTISETYGIGINDNAMKRNNDYGNGNGNGNGNRIGMERDGNETIRGNATVNMRDNNSQVKASAQRGLLKEPTLEGPPGSADSNICAFGQHQQQQQQQQNQRVIEHSGGVGGDGVETLTAPGLQINASALTIPFSSGSSSGISSGAAGGGGGGVSYVSGSAINSGGNNNNTSNNAFGNFTEIAWSSPPTALALVAATTTPTNSPQDAQFTFDQQQQQLQQQQLQQQQQLFTFNAASSSSGVGNNVTGSTAATTVDDGGVDVGSGGIVVGGIAYAAECSNKILTNTAFHAQSCTDLNLNLQLRQNTNSSSMSQVPRIEGFPEAQDYFNQILCGINDVIKTHMNDMHSKFELQFTNMASEVRRRDAIIQQLQLKLRTIETKAQSGSTPSRRRNRERIGHEEHEHERAQLENSSSGSSAELLFMRGDSLDTVFTSSPPMQGDRRGITSPGTSKHGATASASAANYGGIGYAAQQHRNGQQRSSSLHGGSSSKRTRDWAVESARSLGNISGIGGVSGGAVMIADVTGNLARISDSVILDIGESSSSSSSSSKIHVAEADDDEDDDDDDNEAAVMRRRRHRDDVEDDNIDIGTVHIADDNDDDDDDDDDDDGVVAVTAGVRQHVHHNDWEVQMLAAEMERQERRRRGHSLSDNLGELKHCSSFLRRRRKFSDTETECSEPDMEEHASAATAATATTTRAGLSSSSSIAAISSTAGASAAAASTTTAQQQQPSSAPTTTRPRASSLDQFNLRYGIGRGIFKAMSIDRDKDKL